MVALPATAICGVVVTFPPAVGSIVKMSWPVEPTLRVWAWMVVALPPVTYPPMAFDTGEVM